MYKVEYQLNKGRMGQSDWHIAIVTLDGEEAHRVVGPVDMGWTQELTMQEANAWIAKQGQPVQPLEDFVAEGNRLDAQGDADYRYHETATPETQRQAEDNQAQTAAAHYGGIAIHADDTQALQAADCQYVEWKWVEDNGGANFDISKSMEWVKDGRVLRVICDNYYLVI